MASSCIHGHAPVTSGPYMARPVAVECLSRSKYSLYKAYKILSEIKTNRFNIISAEIGEFPQISINANLLQILFTIRWETLWEQLMPWIVIIHTFIKQGYHPRICEYGVPFEYKLDTWNLMLIYWPCKGWFKSLLLIGWINKSLFY